MTNHAKLPIVAAGDHRPEVEIELPRPAAKKTGHPCLNAPASGLAGLRHAAGARGGSFKVRADGEEFSDKRRDGYDVAAILARVDVGWPMTSRRPTVP